MVLISERSQSFFQRHSENTARYSPCARSAGPEHWERHMNYHMDAKDTHIDGKDMYNTYIVTMFVIILIII